MQTGAAREKKARALRITACHARLDMRIAPRHCGRPASPARCRAIATAVSGHAVLLQYPTHPVAACILILSMPLQRVPPPPAVPCKRQLRAASGPRCPWACPFSGACHRPSDAAPTACVHAWQKRRYLPSGCGCVVPARMVNLEYIKKFRVVNLEYIKKFRVKSLEYIKKF